MFTGLHGYGSVGTTDGCFGIEQVGAAEKAELHRAVSRTVGRSWVGSRQCRQNQQKLVTQDTEEGGRDGSWVDTQQILKISTLEVQAEGCL